MTAIRKAFAWIGRNVWALVVALVAILGAGIAWEYHKGKIRSLEDAKAIEEARAAVAALDAERIALAERKVENKKRIYELRVERREIQAELVGLDQDVAAMSDAEVEAAFRELY